MKDWPLNISGFFFGATALILWFLLVERHRPARVEECEDDPGYGDDGFIVRTHPVDGYEWGEREL